MKQTLQFCCGKCWNTVSTYFFRTELSLSFLEKPQANKQFTTFEWAVPSLVPTLCWLCEAPLCTIRIQQKRKN